MVAGILRHSRTGFVSIYSLSAVMLAATVSIVAGERLCSRSAIRESLR